VNSNRILYFFQSANEPTYGAQDDVDSNCRVMLFDLKVKDKDMKFSRRSLALSSALDVLQFGFPMVHA